MAELVHLVRHGEVDNPGHLVYGSLPGFGLTPRGRQQAEAAAQILWSRPITAIWSSPLQRALETAEPMARMFSLPIRIDPDLIEWGLSKSWEGLAWEDLTHLRPGQLEAYLETPCDLPFSAETLEHLAHRVAQAVDRANQRHTSGEVVVVSHQDPLRAGRLRLTGGNPSALHHQKLDLGGMMSLRPGDPWKEVAIDSLATSNKS